LCIAKRSVKPPYGALHNAATLVAGIRKQETFMSYNHFKDAPHGNFRTARDILAEEAGLEAQAWELRAETAGKFASRLRRALGSVARSYVRGFSNGQQYGFRPF
jgi:hypothetical protein